MIEAAMAGGNFTWEGLKLIKLYQQLDNETIELSNALYQMSSSMA